MTAWTTNDIPPLAGRIAIVTGATAGIGYQAALQLAVHGAELVMAVRDTARGNACAAAIRAARPDARITVSAVDLASLASVREFAERASDTLPRIDILINNAGLGLQRERAVTVDGFERQFATNYLGPFALTGRLIPALLRAERPRVVAIASVAHKRGRINLDDLQTERPYNGRTAYGQSKLADLMFALELDRRARLAGSRLVSVAAHPGVAVTNFAAATGMPAPVARLFNLAVGILANDAAAGALPGLYAATMPDVVGGQYWGPNGLMEVRGATALARIAPHAQDRAVWERLWAASEALTGVVFPPLA